MDYRETCPFKRCSGQLVVQHKERRTSHLLEFAVGVSRRNALLIFLLLLLLMMPLLPPESQFGMLPQILRVPRLYCSDPVFLPLFLNISDHFRKSPFSSSPCVHFSLIQIIEKCLQFRDQRSLDQLRSDPLGICSIVPFNRHQYQSLCSDVKQDKAMK